VVFKGNKDLISERKPSMLAKALEHIGTIQQAEKIAEFTHIDLPVKQKNNLYFH